MPGVRALSVLELWLLIALEADASLGGSFILCPRSPLATLGEDPECALEAAASYPEQDASTIRGLCPPLGALPALPPGGALLHNFANQP